MSPTPEQWTAHTEEMAAPLIGPDRFISISRARCIARYRMHTIPGRPEELETNSEIGTTTGSGVIRNKRVISFSYSGGELRIRQHGGPRNREWVDHVDIRLQDGWLDKMYEYLDPYFEYEPPGGKPTPARVTPADLRPRPIRDNPQA